MNTVKSVYYGWGVLILAGGGAYYFAKKSINAERALKAEADHKKRLHQYALETQYQTQTHQNTRKPPPPAPSAQSPLQSSISSTAASRNDSGSIASQLEETKRKRKEMESGNGDKDWVDDASDPSQEASMDPAPTRHAPVDEGQREKEKSKYEASDVFRSRKGDRFS